MWCKEMNYCIDFLKKGIYGSPNKSYFPDDDSKQNHLIPFPFMSLPQAMKKHIGIILILIAHNLKAQIKLKPNEIYEYTYQDNDGSEIEGFIWFDSTFFYKAGNFAVYYENWSMLMQDSSYTKTNSESFWQYIHYDPAYQFLLRKEKNYLINKYNNDTIFPLKSTDIITFQNFKFADRNLSQVEVKLVKKNYLIWTANLEFKCYVFEVSETAFHSAFYPLTPQKTKWTYFIDKKTLLPIKLSSHTVYSDNTESEYNETLTKIMKVPLNVIRR